MRITPDPFGGERDPYFALSQRPGARTVGIDKGLREEILRLVFPPLLSRSVDGFHQRQQRVLIKAARKISTGGRIRDPLRSQTIQESFIIAAQLDIFQTLAIQEGIVSQVQHVITLVIGWMPLEQLQPSIDLLG